MLNSMTGFGRIEKTTAKQRIIVEIKSINSKSFDLRTKISSSYQSKEIAVRKLLQTALIRGKIDIMVTVEQLTANEHTINQQAFINYQKELEALARTQGCAMGDLLYTITRLPGVVVPNDSSVNEEAWQDVLEVVKEAVAALKDFRAQEGAATSADIKEHILAIQQLLKDVTPEEAERIQTIRNRLVSSLEKLQAQIQLDENRLEQEMIYYLDKFDINEEKVRLEQHCNYFLSELEKDIPAKGKKLNFILQEMGREINTLGSKANSAAIQRIVIQMKNQADKIKEQLSNIL